MNKSKKIIIVAAILIVITMVSIGVAIWALLFRETPNVLPPDYPPQETEKEQTPIPDDQGGKIETPSGGGAVNITYGENVTVDLSSGKATLYYANPSRSNQNVAIAIIVGEEVILRSELITPGNMITELPLLDGAYDKLSIGGYNAELVIYCYHPETGEKAMIDTRGSVILTVTE